MDFSLASVHACCGLRVRSLEILSCIARSESPRNKGICLCVNSRSEHGVRVSGGEVAVTVIQSRRTAARTVRVNASAKGEMAGRRHRSTMYVTDCICASLRYKRILRRICVQNMGRSAGQALYEFVCAAVDAFMAGYTFDKLNLQMLHGGGGIEEFKMENAGYRLTASEEYYRVQWLSTIYVTLQMVKLVDNEASRSFVTENLQLVQIIHRTLEGQRHGEEQSFVKFDRGLATKGASGGAVSERLVISPQWVPVTQIVLLTMKVVNENR